MGKCILENYCSSSIVLALVLLGIFNFGKATNITSINNSLSLQNCQLQDLKNIYEYGADLRDIYISHCWIPQLPNALFIRFPELRTLEISDSKLTIVHDYALNGLKNLKSLHFVRNNISELKSWSNNDLVSLHYLDLRRNVIKSVDANRLKRFPHLQKLNLAVNLIEDIPEGTFKIFTHLKYLNFGKNMLRSIFNFTFKGLVKLSHLSLHFNEIEFIEQNAFSTNTHLRSLRLEGNRLRHLDFRITANLYRLCHLNISHNYLESLGNGIFSKTLELQDIDMSYNHIKSLGEYLFQGLQYLEMINATNNYIKEIHFNAFSSLHNLKFLDLSKNNMTFLSSELLQNSSGIQYLNLSKNSIEDIDSNTFSELEMLKNLDLSFNALQTDNFLSLCPSVEFLDMRANSFHQLNLSKIQNIDRVELAGNPWSCNWLIQKMTKPQSSIFFGTNYIVTSHEHSLSIAEVDCLDGTEKRSIVIVNKMNGIEEIRQKSTIQNIVKWSEFKTAFDSFDQKSVVIWLIIAIALVFTAVRVGRGWMQRSEKRSKELRRLQREKMLKDVEDYFDTPNIDCERN